jgi:hypothetical protein
MPKGVRGSARLKEIERAKEAKRKREARVMMGGENQVKNALSMAYGMKKGSARTVLENAKTQLENRRLDFADSDRVTGFLKRLESRIQTELDRLG